MNIPGFTAEVTLYNSVTPYRSSCFIHTEVGLNVTPQLGFIGEWMARLSSEAAFFGGVSSGGSSPADIFERKMCIELRRRCGRGDVKACRQLAEDC
jgi:hypothetical protein